jgi:hypothetical protein
MRFARAMRHRVRRSTAWTMRPGYVGCAGAFGNRLVEREPQRAFAIASMRADGSITVSVRVPPGASVPAHRFCRRWPGGGGREIAAGIDRLDAAALDALAADFIATYGTP